MTRTILSAALLALACAGAAAHENQAHKPRAAALAAREQKPWGIAGDPAAVRRTIDIRMTDAMRFHPDRIEVREGETVRLRVRNAGQVLHELVIGTKEELDQHAALMKKHPGMEHDEPYMSHVKPGASGEIVWNFNRPGEFDYACLIPGHYEAGMTGKIRVVARKEQSRCTEPIPPAARCWPSAPRCWPPPAACRPRAPRPPGASRWRSGRTPSAAAARTG